MKDLAHRDLLPRRVGRPSIAPAGVATSVISTRLPTPCHDQLIAVAQREGISVAAVARRLLILRLT